jgi:CO/xanthine dehydrogenase Mo-binding subunit
MGHAEGKEANDMAGSTFGSSPPRRDGRAKVEGHALYQDDRREAGTWHGATVRSPHPHARIRSIDPSGLPPGAVAVTAADVDGVNGLQILDDTWPLLAEGEVHHVGEAVALVAAPTAEAARRAAAAVTVDYELLPAVLGWEEAARHEPLSALSLIDGDVEAALATSEVVVEGVYETGLQEHIYIECQAMGARWEEDGSLVVHGSMQCPYYVKKALVHAFALPEEKVRVVGRPMGGGFGGKEDYPSLLGAHCALLSRKAGRPVQIVYDRHEDIVATTKRHPSRTRIRAGVGRDGTLKALAVDFDLDGGAYRGLSPVVLSRGVLHATGCYRVEAAAVRGRVLRTNTTPTGAFRGFGAPQALFAVERHMDRIARVLGLDPLTVRRRNVLREGDRLPTGQILDHSTAAEAVLERVAEKTDFLRRWRENEAVRGRAGDDGRPRKGLGLSLYFHGAGFTGLGEHRMRSPVTARITDAGRLRLLTAATEMGQGAHWTLPLIAAESAGLALDDVEMAEPDTAEVPDSGPTVASRTSMIVGGAVSRVAAELCRHVLAWKGETLGGVELRCEAGAVHGPQGAVGSFAQVAAAYAAAGEPRELTVHHEPPTWQQFDDATYKGSAYPTYSWGADVVEVEVDPDTFEVVCPRCTVVAEVGKVLHEVQCRGQIEGGTLQALGWGLLEELQLEEGRYRNDRLATYILPTILDAPAMDVELLEFPWEGEPGGAKGVGELPMDGGAPAAVSAIENACGLVGDSIPAVPERLFAWHGAGRTAEALGPAPPSPAEGARP